MQAHTYFPRQVKGRLVVEESAITSNSEMPERDTLTSQVLPCPLWTQVMLTCMGLMRPRL